mmetsp:Transcript_32137/g.59387  ORF Transcript_32137/g.59387 Transcript_32137/m.59387 type:complete len:113 (-) Transcript_32137:49-387(-)
MVAPSVAESVCSSNNRVESGGSRHILRCCIVLLSAVVDCVGFRGVYLFLDLKVDDAVKVSAAATRRQKRTQRACVFKLCFQFLMRGWPIYATINKSKMQMNTGTPMHSLILR